MIEARPRVALVTGASGTLGRRLCARLREEGWRVIGLSTSDPGHGPWDLYLTADLSDPLSEALGNRLTSERVAVVWHLAGKAHALADLRQDPAEYHRVNVEGTQHVLALAKRIGARRLVLASSTKAMGEGEASAQDESATCVPLSPYGRSKLEAEKVVLAARAAIEPVVLRFCMVYGGPDRGNMGRMLSAVRRGRFPPFPETGNRRSFVYINDAIAACLLAGTAERAVGEVFLVTDGRLHSTRELYLALRQVLGLKPPGWTPPLMLFLGAAKIGDGLGRLLGRRMPLDSDALAKLSGSAAYSSEKITRLLGYVPAWPLQRGLAQMAHGLDEEEASR